MTDTVRSISSTFTWPGAGETDNLWRKLGSLYGDVLQRSWQEWLNSSAQIVQQHAVRAFVETSQALLENATQLQQKTWGQMIDTNQRAAAIVADGVTRATTEAVGQATAQAVQAATQAGNAVADHVADAANAANPATGAGRP